MTTFTVWKFDDPGGAERAAAVLAEPASVDGDLRIIDHAVVTWPIDAVQPETDRPPADPRPSAAWAAFWGVVTGTLVTLPVLGGVAGAVIGARAAATPRAGLSREALARIRTQVTPGSSALFLVTDEGDVDRLGDRFRQVDKTLIHTSVSP